MITNNEILGMLHINVSESPEACLGPCKTSMMGIFAK